jgi:hypothetical protein
MTPITDDKLAELLAGLEGVTPGPWKHLRDPNAIVKIYPNKMANPLPVALIGSMASKMDGPHLARCDPDTIRSLITRLQAAETKLAKLGWADDDHQVVFDDTAGETGRVWHPHRGYWAYKTATALAKAQARISQYEEALEGLNHALTGTRWKHVKTGGEYTVVGACRIEATNVPAYLYRSEKDGTVWARPMDDFLDGRFARTLLRKEETE